MADDEGFVSASSGELEQLDGSSDSDAIRNKGVMQHGCEHYRLVWSVTPAAQL